MVCLSRALQCIPLIRTVYPSLFLERGNNLLSNNVTKSFHSISRTWPLEKLLKVEKTPQISFYNGMKQKAVLKRRCEDCYFMWRKGRLYNYCKTKPKHNQMQIVPKEKDTWILTFSSVKPRRDW